MNDIDRDRIRFADCVVHATNSNDPSTQTGAVIVFGNTVIASGFNYIPVQFDLDPIVLGDKELKYARVIHAEMMAVMNCMASMKNATLYTLRPPCERCMAHIVYAGITEVVVPKEACHEYGVWDGPHAMAFQMAQEAGVNYRHV